MAKRKGQGEGETENRPPNTPTDTITSPTNPHAISKEGKNNVPGPSSTFAVIGQIAQGITTPLALAALAILIVGVLAWQVLNLTSLDKAQTFMLLLTVEAVIVIYLGLALRTHHQVKSSDGTNLVPSPAISSAQEQPKATEVHTIQTLVGKTFLLIVADTSDYAAAVSRLHAHLSTTTMAVDSLTALGIYGQRDLLFEIVCNVSECDKILEQLSSTLEPPGKSPKPLEKCTVIEIAKFNRVAIGGSSIDGKRVTSTKLIDGSFGQINQPIKYEVEPPPHIDVSGDIAAVCDLPYIIAYLWIEAIVLGANGLDKALETTYSHVKGLAASEGNEINGLYLLDNAVVIKSVFPKERHYNYTKFTKRIDGVLRQFSYSELLAVRTVIGAEVICWQ